MTKYQLLESIGAVDEALLQECETAKYVRKPVVFKVMLVAAIITMLTIGAAAVKHHFFTDVNTGEVVPATIAIQTLDADWNVVDSRKTAGYRLEADIETVKDAPMYLLYPYLPTVPDAWECNGVVHAKYDGAYGMIGITWNCMIDGMQYEVFYRQESAYFYNTRETPAVWWLTDVPEDVTVTGQVTEICGASVYQVTVSSSKIDRNFQSYTQMLIFWSDGYSIFQLCVPQIMPMEQVEALMLSLTLQEELDTALQNLK